MKKILILTLFVAVHLMGMAQTDSTKRSTTTILFGDGKIVDNSPKYKYHTIKINFLDCFGGKYGLYYENKLSNAVGIEVGIGLTGRNLVGNFFRDAILELETNQESPTFSSELDIIDKDYDFESRESTLGYFLALIPKWYYGKDKGLDGNYFALNLQYRRHNFDAYGLDPIFAVQGYETYNKNELPTREFEFNYVGGLAWGKQIQMGIVTFDFLFSTGINYVTGEKRDVGLIDSPNHTVVVAEKLREISILTAHLEAAIKFGFCWK